MKTAILFFLNLLLISTSVMSQESKDSAATESNKSKFSFGFVIGGGQNANGYRLTPDNNNFTYFEGDILFTTGVNASLFVTERLRPRLELTYSEMKYGLNWDSNYSSFEKTITKTMNFNVNLNLDYLILNKPRFQVFLSPGIVTEFATGVTHKNYQSDGDVNFSNYSVFTDPYPSAIAGANFSILAKYRFSKHIGFTATPGYNYYFRKFAAGNDKAYTRTLLNFGVEYTF